MRTLWLWLTCGVLFALELALGIYMSIHNQFIYGDALSRVANAFYVLYSRDPHLAAIGMIWNPLPSVLSLPILLFQPLFPSLAPTGLPMIILSALFTSLTVFVLIKSFGQMSKATYITGLFCALLIAINPFIFWYGANGMSEAIFGFLIVYAMIQWTDWLKSGRIQSLIITSITMIPAFLTRYEAIPFAAVVIVVTIMIMYSDKQPFRTIESSIILLSLPIIFACISWLWLNYTIMGDALYFLRSSYSNQGQSVTLVQNDQFTDIVGSPVNSFIFMLQRTAIFLIPYAAITMIRLMSQSLRRVDFIALSMLVFSIPIFQWFMLVNGSSFGWLRFFYYPLLITAAWMPYELSLYNNIARPYFLRMLVIGSFAASAIIVVPIMNNSSYAPEEYNAINYRNSTRYIQSTVSRNTANTVDEEVFNKYPNALVLTDSFNAFEIIMNSKYPDRYVNSTDRDFRDILENPLAYDTEFIIVPKPDGALNDLNAVFNRYLGFYDEQQHWVKLEREFEGGWRLFRVISEPPQSQ